MEVMSCSSSAGMCLNALLQIPNSKYSASSSSLSRHYYHHQEDGLIGRHSFLSYNNNNNNTQIKDNPIKRKGGGRLILAVKAKGRRKAGGGGRGGQSRRFQRPPPPTIPKLEADDGNPRFVVFIRNANVYIWYPLSIVAGGTTAKIILDAKDTFVGKFIYKDTLARNLGAVIYKDEKSVQKTAIKQHRVLRAATEFRYGYKLVENGDMKAALSTTDVIELPQQDELKTVVDKVKDFFGNAKESFGKLTSIDSTKTPEAEENSNEKTK